MKSFKEKAEGKKYPFAIRWREMSEAGLQRHIAIAHLRPDIMRLRGVPIFDIELAWERGFRLDPVVCAALGQLALPPNGFYEQLPGVTTDGHRLAVAKTIKLIDDFKLAAVPWDQVEELYPGASGLVIDLASDSSDYSFAELLADNRI